MVASRNVSYCHDDIERKVHLPFWNYLAVPSLKVVQMSTVNLLHNEKCRNKIKSSFLYLPTRIHFDIPVILFRKSFLGNLLMAAGKFHTNVLLTTACMLLVPQCSWWGPVLQKKILLTAWLHYANPCNWSH